MTTKHEGWQQTTHNDPGYGDYIKTALTEYIESGQTFVVDDITDRARELAPDGATPHSPNLIGAIIGSWAAHGHIEAVGFRKAGKTSRRGARVFVFRAVKSAA